jgi:Holliday junction resolvase RusA-like endonuclease
MQKPLPNAVAVFVCYDVTAVACVFRTVDNLYCDTQRHENGPPTSGAVFVCYDVCVNITLVGQAISTQSCYRSTTANGYNRSYMTQKCIDLKTDWQWQARSQWKGAPLEGPVSVKMALYHGDKHKRDIDNFNKLVFDALAGIAFEDDNQITELIIRKFYDKQNPRVSLEISTAS